jgi:hypothetical protein
MKRKARILVRGAFLVLALSAVFSASASASPAWNFAGKALEGKETIMGGAFESSLTLPGLVTKCENFLYKLTIENSVGTGKGEVTEVPLYNCGTNSKYCTVKTIGAEALPYPSHLTKVETTNYMVIEGVKVAILYAGSLCALGGTTARVTGTAGGSLNNETETATFNAASFAATKTELRALGGKAEWAGVFPTEAFEWHREEALTVS